MSEIILFLRRSTQGAQLSNTNRGHAEASVYNKDIEDVLSDRTIERKSGLASSTKMQPDENIQMKSERDNDVITHDLVSSIEELKLDIKLLLDAQKSENKKLKHLSNRDIEAKDNIKTLDSRLKEYFDDMSLQFNSSSGKIIEANNIQSGEISGNYNDIVNRISSGQKEITTICNGIKQLQLSAENGNSQSDQISKSIEHLIGGVTNSQKNLELLTNNLKTMMEDIKSSNVKERESLVQLKVGYG